LLLGQQQACLSTSQGVIHLIRAFRLEVDQAVDVDTVGDEADEHGSKQGHVIQHPCLAECFL